MQEENFGCRVLLSVTRIIFSILIQTFTLKIFAAPFSLLIRQAVCYTHQWLEFHTDSIAPSDGISILIFVCEVILWQAEGVTSDILNRFRF